MSFIQDLAAAAHVSPEQPRNIEAGDFLKNPPTIPEPGTMTPQEMQELNPPDEEIDYELLNIPDPNASPIKAISDEFLEKLPSLLGKSATMAFPLMEALKKILLKRIKDLWKPMVNKMGRQTAKKYYYSLQSDINGGKWDEIMRLDDEMKKNYEIPLIYER